MTDSTSGLDDSVWYDVLRSPAGDIVLMPCSNREAYLRAGFVLVQAKSYDIRRQMSADWVASSNRGLPSDDGHQFPATFPA